MPLEFDRMYRLRPGNDLGDPDTLNGRFQHIDVRIGNLEALRLDWSTALAAVTARGNQLVSEAVAPVYDTLAGLGNLGAIFSATSTTSLIVSTGLKRVTISPAQRGTFAPAAYVALFKAGDPSIAMLGVNAGYDRATGELQVVVDRISGSGTAADWVVHAASATDNAAAKVQAEAARDAAITARDAAIASSTEANTSQSLAATFRGAALSSAELAAASAAEVAVSKGEIYSALASQSQIYLGGHTSDPTTDLNGDPLVNGSQYFNTASGILKTYHNGGWVAAVVPVGSEVVSIFGRTGAVSAQGGDYDATKITFTPAANIGATNVQAAIVEAVSDLTALIAAKLDSTSYTAADVLAKLQTVDGAGSGLDADTLDGISSAGFALANHTQDWSTITSRPTTLSGYGISDAVAASQLGAANGVATLGSDGRLTTAQIPSSLVGALVYQGTWNASTNSPTLTSSVGTKGHYYKVGVAGATSINGNASWQVGDHIIFNGTAWDRLEGDSTEVTSVAGRVGAIVLTAADIGDSSAAGRTLLTAATAAAQKAALGIAATDIGDSSAAGRTLLTAATAAAQKAALGIVATDITNASVTGRAVLTAADAAAARSAIGAEAALGYTPMRVVEGAMVSTIPAPAGAGTLVNFSPNGANAADAPTTGAGASVLFDCYFPGSVPSGMARSFALWHDYAGSSLWLTGFTTTGTQTGWHKITTDTNLTTLVRAYTAAQYFAETTLTDAATIAWDLDTRQVAKVTLAGNRTLGAPTNKRAGATYVLRVIQDATGGRTLGFTAGHFKWAGGVAPVLSTAAGAVDILTFVCDGTYLYGTIQKAFA